MDTITDADLFRPEPFRWADRIAVKRHGKALRVRGECFRKAEQDLFRRYSEDNPPHVEFANCSSDSQLITFVEKYGPVVASRADYEFGSADADRFERISDELLSDGTVRSALEHLDAVEQRMALRPTTREKRSAVQDLEELRNERELFKAAVDLTRLLTPAAPTRPPKKSQRITKVVSEVPRDEEPSREALGAMVACLEIIADRSSDWLRQFERERSALQSELSFAIPVWHWGRDWQHEMDFRAHQARKGLEVREKAPNATWLSVSHPRLSARAAVCSLLNSFPLVLSWSGDNVMDVPAGDLLRGIRPALFAMLRRDLQTGREIRRCARPGCNNLFIVSRIDKECCSTACSARNASNRYYRTKRKLERERARAEARKMLESSTLKEG